MSRDQLEEAALAQSRGEATPDPALEALVALLNSELDRAVDERPQLVSQADPGRLWLLWFAIGATLEMCTLLRRETDTERNTLFRGVADAVFREGIRSDRDPIAVDRRLIDLFESAGAAAVQARQRGDRRTGYYLAGLRVSVDRGIPPLLN
jgi:hypothetical protein